MAKILVQTGDFDVGAEIAVLTAGRTDIGGLGCFVGIVREDKAHDAPDRPIQALTLEHYPAMTARAIGRIVEEAERRWSLLGCTVIHRVGRMLPGERRRAAPAGRLGFDGVSDRLVEDQGAVLETRRTPRWRGRLG